MPLAAPAFTHRPIDGSATTPTGYLEAFWGRGHLGGGGIANTVYCLLPGMLSGAV